MTDDDISRILAAAIDNRRDYLLIRLLIKTGMRIGEAHRIAVGDIDKENRVIYIPIAKRDERREVPIDQITLSLLRSFIIDYKIGGAGV